MSDRAREVDGMDSALKEVLCEAYGLGAIHVSPRDFIEKGLAGLFRRQPDMSGDQRKRLMNHELAAVGREADYIMRALVIALERDKALSLPADKNAVERVEQEISAWAFAHGIDGAVRNDLFKRLRAIAALSGQGE